MTLRGETTKKFGRVEQTPKTAHDRVTTGKHYCEIKSINY